MRMEYCAYSFLSEDGSLCDYEIATDELASMTAVCAHHVKHIKRKDIQEAVVLSKKRVWQLFSIVKSFCG